ncbi:MAG TPA: ISNCY family transposase, partial [Verrucomicrobiales bacterium]|nr:ISNCY family transposase [Verrucomicrobiales bacterium]
MTGLSESFGIKCWRKAKYWKKVIKGQMRQVGRIKHGGGKNKEERLPKAVRIYLSKSGELEQKVAENIEELTAVVTRQLQAAGLGEARYFHQMLIKHIDLVKRRMLEEETIPHEEKIFSLFEPHTEWINKGKLHPPVELGHKILITTDQHQLVLDYKVMEKSADNQETLPMARRLFENYGENAFASMSFDKGFSRAADREELEQKVPLVVMPKKGRLSAKDKERESTRQFIQFKNRHSAIESDINSLEHHGLSRCRD